METYIVRLYRDGAGEDQQDNVLGVVEVAGCDTRRYFSKITELPAIFQELSDSEYEDEHI